MGRYLKLYAFRAIHKLKVLVKKFSAEYFLFEEMNEEMMKLENTIVVSDEAVVGS